MEKRDRIQEYAEKLHQEEDFKSQLLRRIARDIYLQLQAQKEEGTRLLYDELKVLSYLEKLLTNFFQFSEFWERQANWILSNLEIWNLEDKEPFPFPSLNDLPKPTSLEVKQRESYLQSLCAFNTAGEILQTLNASSLSLEVLEHLRESGKHTPPTTEPRLAPISDIPTSALMVSSIQAQLRKDFWQQDCNGIAFFHHRCKSNPSNYIEHYIASPGDITLLPWDAAEQIIDKFGFNTVKLQLIFAAYTMKQNEPWKSPFKLKASDIIKELGWDKGHKSNLADKRNEIASIAHALSSLLVRTVWIEGIGKNQINASTPTGRMWDVLIDPHGQMNILTGNIDQPNEVYLTIRPGLWTENFLNRAGRTAREALHQFGYLALNILKIDPYHDELALRLAIHLTLDSRIRARDKNPYDYRVLTLLESVLPRTAIEAAQSDRYKARDLKKRWNSALKLLSQLGWQIDFDESYPEWLRPESEAPKPPDWRKTKTIDQLVEAWLTIKPPAPIPERLATIAKAKPKKPRKLKPAPAPRLTGEQIQKSREAMGWSRKKLGGYLDLSADYIGKLERGDRIITPELEAKFRKLLPILD